MAIDAYVGLPGHGKSYSVVEHVVIPSLKQGRHVVTNIPLNADALLMDFGGLITQLPEDWHEVESLDDLVPHGAVFIVDECWRRWPSGQSTHSASVSDKSLFAEHRHRVDVKGRSMRVVLVTQDLAQISNWLRLLVENTYRISKKSKKFYTVFIHHGAITGTRPPAKTIIRQTGGAFKKEIYQYYSSATFSESGTVGDESKADNRSSILKSFGLWAAFGSAFLLFLFGSMGVNSFFNSSPSAPKASTDRPVERAEPVPKIDHSHSSGAVSNALVTVYPVASDTPPLSALWRVGGFVRSSSKNSIKAGEFAVLVSGERVRYVELADCEYFKGGIDVYCDIDGERVTPWTGQAAITSVYGSNSIQAQQIKTVD